MSYSTDWVNDLTWSNKLFVDKVWPVIRKRCGGGEIKPVEIMPDIISRDLDMLCGIDVWHTVPGAGARGIASRVQRGGRNWGSFTIRYKRASGAKTEYEKRLEAIKTGQYIYPYLTCQAYFDKDKLIGGGFAKTIDIFNAIDLTNTNKSDNEFLIIPFKNVVGVKVFCS